MDDEFSKMQDLLRAKDDTSRFVGLALLKSLLDNGQLAQEPQKILTLWEALSPKFLDRLLRAQSNEKIDKSEANNMIDLAVSVLHTFSILLPDESRSKKRYFGRSGPLVKALVESPPETTKLILQALFTIASRKEGALELLKLENVSPLTEIAAQQPYVLDIFNMMWTNSSSVDTEKVRESIDKTMPILLLIFKGTDAVTLVRFAGYFMRNVEPRALSPSPAWLRPLILVLRQLVVSKPTQTGRTAYTKLASAILQIYHASPALLFCDDAVPKEDRKPFSNLFINLLLIDIRSSIPSLLAQLNDNNYPSISERLGAAFDVVSGFIGFLVKTLDDETASHGFIMPPDLLLKLRKDMAETMSLTIEYLRDRWDASIAGAAGLHPLARTGTAATSEGTRLTLTWESMKDNVNEDPLILGAIRTVAIWICEDENDNLRNETAGLMDMFLELYKSSTLGPDALDFRYPILLALEGVMTTDDGISTFLAQEGWDILMGDLSVIFRGTPMDLMVTASRGLEIVRVLIAVIDHESTTSPQESWMSAVVMTTSMKPVTATPAALEFQTAMLQLSSALLSKAAGAGMQKRFVTSIPALSGLSNQLSTIVEGIADRSEAAELQESLDDVNLELENLRLR